MSERWIRRGGAVILDHADALTLLGPRGAPRRFTDASADVMRAALAFFESAHTEEELGAHIEALAGRADPALVADMMASLREVAAIQVFQPEVRARTTPEGARVLLGVSGAIAASDAPALVRALQARGHEVTVMMTASAAKFVRQETLAALTHRPAYRSFWQKHGEAPAPHIHLAGWPDLVVVYPASASTIARIATGACTDVLSAAVTATSRPVLVVPSMNEGMIRAPAVQRNLETLRADGRYLLGGGLGMEVAAAPQDRLPMWGAAPALSQVVTAIDLLLREIPRAPRRREGWDDKYEGGEPPWFTETLDEDLAEILRGIGGGRLLDLGAGPGTLAIFAADHGFQVTALDTSGAALALARKRADKRSIAWVLGDVLDPPPLAEFDVAADRGCLHCLPRAEWPRYAATLARAVRRGGLLILKEHAPEEGGKHGTQPPSAEELAEILGPAFAMKQWRASTFAGKIAPAPSAILSVWVRQ